MFIKEVKKKNKRYTKVFTYHRLMESYRTDRGPRQRTILELGKLDLPKDQWKLLADSIESKLTGQQSLFPVDKHIEVLATHYVNLIIHRQLIVAQALKGKPKGTRKQNTPIPKRSVMIVLWLPLD